MNNTAHEIVTEFLRATGNSTRRIDVEELYHLATRIDAHDKIEAVVVETTSSPTALATELGFARMARDEALSKLVRKMLAFSRESRG